MRLVVGLGNPGRSYVGTRHNIGYEVVDCLAAKLGWCQGDYDRLARMKFDGLAMDGMAQLPGGTQKLVLLKPTTFMNLSGRSVQAAMAFYQLTAADLLVVLDDMALPCGRLRLRKEGSSGGHNGLKDIEQALGSNQYPRLRIGIDAPPSPVPGKDYVLGRFTEPQRRQLETAIDRAALAALNWMDQGIETAMNIFNAEAEAD